LVIKKKKIYGKAKMKFFGKTFFKIKNKNPHYRLKWRAASLTYFNPMIYLILFNSFTRNGMRHRSHKMAWEIMQNIRKKKWRRFTHNHVNLDNIFYNLFTPLRIRKKKVGGRIELVPSVPSYKYMIGAVVRWIKKGSTVIKKKNKFKYLESVIYELGNAFRKTGFSFHQKKMLEFEAEMNRKNVKYLKKRFSLKRNKNKLPKNKTHPKKRKLINFKIKFSKRKLKRLKNYAYKPQRHSP